MNNADSNWCIFYCKTSDPTSWHTMKLWRSDGVLVSAKTYDDVYKRQVISMTQTEGRTNPKLWQDPKKKKK